MEEKASRKERKKEVVEVLRVRVGGCAHLAPPFRPSQCPWPLVVIVWEANSQPDTALSGPQRRRRMELRRKKKKPLRTERRRMKEKKKVGRGKEQSQGGLEDLM